MLRFEDNIRGHAFYRKAAKGAVEAYLALADKPKNANGADENNMTEAEKKKAKSKARKAELKAQDTNKMKKEEPQNPKKQDAKRPVDQDPNGEKYLNTTTPLEDALQFIKPLQLLAPNDVETHALGFEIYLRQSMWLLALRCLVKTSEIDKSHPSIAPNLERFKKAGTLSQHSSQVAK